MSLHILGPDGSPITYATKAGESGGTILGYLGSTLTGSEARDLSEAEFCWHIAQHHPWAGSAIGLIADAIAGCGYDIVAPGPDQNQTQVDQNDPVALALRIYLENVNPEKNIVALMHEVAMDYDAVGRAYLYVMREPITGANSGLARIDARTMAPILADDGKSIKCFRQRIRVNGFEKTVDYKPSDIYFFRRPGPDPLLGGESLLNQLDLTLAVDLGARKHNAAYYRNGARAGQYLVNETATKEQLEFNKRIIEEARAPLR